MKISKVLYDAACQMSHYTDGWGNFSCDQVLAAARDNLRPVDSYSRLMASDVAIDGWLHGIDVSMAAHAVRWSMKDYRTFMLLMASAAFKAEGR